MKLPRFRLSTLMLIIIILALALTLVSDRWKREQERRRKLAERAAFMRSKVESLLEK